MANAAESKFWLKGEKRLDSAIRELNNAHWVYLHEGPASKGEYENNIIRPVLEALHELSELERELFWHD